MVPALEKIIAESDRIVFFGGAGVSTESGILISAAWTACTTRSTITRPRPS